MTALRARARRAALVVAALLGVLALAVAGAEAAGWPFLRQPLQEALARMTGAAVRLDGAFHLRLLGNPRLHVSHLQVAPAHGIDVPHLLEAREVDLAWRWIDLWRWYRGTTRVLHLRLLQVDTFDARLIRRDDGRATWEFGRPGAAAGDAAAVLPRLARLQVRRGHVVLDDAPMRTRLEAELQGAEGEALPDGAVVGYTARVSGHWRDLPVQLRVESGAALLAAGQAPAARLPLRVAGRAGPTDVQFDGSTALPGTPTDLEGRLHLRGPSLAEAGAPLGVTLPHTPAFDLRGMLALREGVWQLHAERAVVGRSELEGDFRFDTRAQPPRLQGRLGGRRLVLADLAPAVGAPGREQRGERRPDRVLPQRRFDLPSLRVMDADLQVAIGELDFDSRAVNAMRALRTHLTLQGGVLQLAGLEAQVAGGRLSGLTRLDPNAALARWDADLRFDGVDLAAWLPVLRKPARGRTGPAPAYLTGQLDAGVRVAGQGRSTAEILATLDGRARLRLRHGTLSHLATEVAGLDLAQALGVLVREDRPLPLRCARLDLQIRQGVAHIVQGVLDNSDSTLNLEGRVNLRDESLALRARARPKDFSPLSLRSPLLVGGTLAAPRPAVEGGPLAAKVLGALALGVAVGPALALLPLIDPGQATPEADAPCAPPPSR